MSDLKELYQRIVLDHGRRPRNFRALEGANRQAEGSNPLCGDHLHVYLYVNEDDIIEEICFDGAGCAISTASASLMSSALKGKTCAEAGQLFAQFQEMVTADLDEPVDAERIGKLAVLAGVREFPMRIKCATLAWHTMKAALERDGDKVTTE